MIKNPFTMHIDADSFLPATEEEKAYMVQMRESSTFFKDGMKRLVKNKVAFLSMICVIVIALTSIFLPMFWPYSYDQQLGVNPGKPVDPSYNNLEPFAYGRTEQKAIDAGEEVFPHVFGTDSAGRAFVNSITNRDYPLIMGTTIVLATLIVFMNLVSDLLYKIVDPRITLE